MMYLNDVEEGGETAFPMAGEDTYDPEVSYHYIGMANCFCCRKIFHRGYSKLLVTYDQVLSQNNFFSKFNLVNFKIRVINLCKVKE